ncbi:RNA polymerase sigma factor [Lentiprolixibacter aurantiacus]|uniref:Sigma-70 family RNA polymerase sigma factor n=1 Tax=Lentiprolixibacter aurantiacus TaxID=2993939 RepID=A0AAE3MMH8_9FLAO|nr:sigma-70 family RNA polymerase sigma factor [Lentiprolixibacter aurantiacus]MCX2720168.1 sigma-70 family RNA polymerase sigma factor [Lentiprolixibacter aurantiacus]
MGHHSDQHLIKRLKEGDKQAFITFIGQYKHMVYTLALRIVKNEEDAEEVSQDAFLKAYQSIGTFKGDAKLSTWLYRIAYHRSLDCLKKNKRKPSTTQLQYEEVTNIQIAEMTWDHMERMERKQIIQRALGELPGDDGVILSLFYFESLSLKEISEVLNISVNSVKVRLHRGRKRLASVLEKMMDKETISIYES